MEIKNITFNASKQVKKTFMEYNKKNIKRVAAENWSFTLNDYNHENQLNNVKKLIESKYEYTDETTKIILQEIKKKIYGYKRQDIIKKLLNIEKFITLTSITNKMVECELKCYYCSSEMNILYDISREMKQWTVDRIDNNLGHNSDNYYLACLECNLKRRRRSDEKFLFTKQMRLVKLSGENINEASLL